MRVGVDIDVTVADYNMETTLKKHVGRRVSDDLFICYMEAAVEAKPSKGLYDAYREYALKKAKIVRDSTDVMKRLKNKGHGIIIYSNRTVFMTPRELTDWLKENSIPFSEVWTQKTPPVLDFHIDDNPAKLVNLGSNVTHKVLLDQPWNQQCTDEFLGVRRVKNWLEFETLVENPEPKPVDEKTQPAKVHVRGKNAGDVLLYALSTCPWCRRVRELLDNLGIEYICVYVDILKNPEKEETIQSVKKFNPAISFPLIVVNGERKVVGYKENEIREAVKGKKG